MERVSFVGKLRIVYKILGSEGKFLFGRPEFRHDETIKKIY
jgi:hypothetical protein